MRNGSNLISLQVVAEREQSVSAVAGTYEKVEYFSLYAIFGNKCILYNCESIGEILGNG